MRGKDSLSDRLLVFNARAAQTGYNQAMDMK